MNKDNKTETESQIERTNWLVAKGERVGGTEK